MTNYGSFTNLMGGYSFDKLPTAGKLEYFLRNEKLLLKLDQYGINSLQYDAPVGVFAFKRERRETYSPIKIYFNLNGKVVHNFDVINATSFNVEYKPSGATYSLKFGDFEVVTKILIFDTNLLFDVEFKNNSSKEITLKLMPVTFPFMTDLSQAPWDMVEWYTKAHYDVNDRSVLHSTRYSVAAKKEERRYLNILFNEPLDLIELSLENLVSSTKNYSEIPNAMVRDTANEIYGVEQVLSGIKNIKISSNNSYVFNQLLNLTNNEKFDKNSFVKTITNEFFNEKQKEVDKSFEKMFSLAKIETPDKDFNNFVNGFIPLEISWVASLDRGWGTGMRGVRDAANDFMGYLYYNKDEARKVVETILSKQRDDGWYPRQVPFDGSDKMDLREFVDNGCFFFELVFEYLSFTNDYSILDKKYPYYNSNVLETGFTHIKKGVEFLMKPENLGIHGLVKLRGGDWLDCLNGVGKEGRAETVMVSCQMILSLEQYMKILSVYKPDEDVKKYQDFIHSMKDSINKHSFNKLGFYNAIFSDDGKWFLSDKDVDGELRVYAPTNSYCLLTGVADGKEEQVIKNLESLKTEYGYKLFTTPFGRTYLPTMGKMGTGDFQPYFAENGSVYNHGSQCFYIRALAKLGKYELLGSVMDFALPLYRKEEETCGAKYAVTNCYQLYPGYKGRQMFSFLTGTIAMSIRAIYNWMFGLQFNPKTINVIPCIPEKYKNSTIEMNYLDGSIKIEYEGFGSKISKAYLDGSELALSEGKCSILKENIKKKSIIKVVLEK